MKRLLLIISIVINLSLASHAQQRPHYSQYLQNMEVINPAFSGIYKNITVKAGFRNQWMGVEGAPKTTYFTAHTPLNFTRGNLITGSSDYGVEEPYTRSDKDDYESSDNHHGLGLIALNDKAGPINRSAINLAYSYHIAINDITNLSLGLGAGVSKIALNESELRFDEPNDPVVNSGQVTKWTPDINLGFYLYSSQFYFGGSIQQIVKEKLSFSEELNLGKEVSHFFLTAGYRFFIGEDISLTPSVMLKYVAPAPKALDLNLKVNFRNNFWLGSSYRKKDAFAVMAGFNINRMLNFGYSYDYTTSSIKTISTGTQEFVLGINL